MQRTAKRPTAIPACLSAFLCLSACTTTLRADRFFKPPSPEWAAYLPDLAVASAQIGEETFDADAFLHKRIEAGGQEIAVSMVGLAGLQPDHIGGTDLIDKAHRADDPDRPLILYCHGSQADRHNYASAYALSLLWHGDPVIWDFPGYGDSSGEAGPDSLARVTPDMAAWIDELAGERDLVLWGYSLGGWVCADIAARSRAVDALILEATAISAHAVAANYSRMIPFLRVRAASELDGFDIPDMLDGSDVPVLVLSGGRDRDLRPALQDDLAEAVGAELYQNPATTHFDTYRHPDTRERVRSWLADLGL